MKKLILFFAIVLVGGLAFARTMPHFIITGCGTVHPVYGNPSPEQLEELIDYWTEKDCN